MKTLFLVRHAKSGWEYSSARDIDRPLSEGGIQAAYSVSNQLLLKDDRPEWIVSSNANRALHTATIFARVLDVPKEAVSINPSLYLCSNNQVYETVSQLPEQLNSAALFFHNPTMTEIANELSSVGLFNVKTCGLLRIELPDWNLSASQILSIRYFDRKDWHQL